MAITFGNLSILLLYLMFIVQYAQPQVALGLPNGFPMFLIVVSALMPLIFLNENLFKFLRYKQVRWILVLMGLLLIMTPFTPVKGASFNVIKSWLIQCLFLVPILALVDNFQRFKSLITFVSAMTISFALYTLVFQPEFKRYAMGVLSNFLKDPNDYSLFLNMMIPWILLTASYQRSIIKLFFWVGLMMVILVDLLTYSRGGLMGLIVVFIVLTLYHPKRYQILSITTCLVLVGGVYLSSSWLDVMSTAADAQSATAQTRLVMWNASWEVFKDNPLGAGPGSIGALAWLEVPPNTLGFPISHWYGDVNHSFWFTALAEWGLIGFGILLYLIKLNIKDCFRLMRLPRVDKEFCYLQESGVAALASLGGFLMSTTFLTSNYYPHWWALTAYICIASKLWAEKNA